MFGMTTIRISPLFFPAFLSIFLSFPGSAFPIFETSPSGWRDQGDQQKEQRTQVVLLPFQNAPGPRSSEADPHHMSPYGTPSPSTRPETHQSGFRFDQCLDTDRCVFIVLSSPSQKERRILVELFGTDVPLLRGHCEQEKVLAEDAIELLREVLTEASQIEVYDHFKVGRKHIARVVVNGQDLSELLIGQGLAAPKGQGRREWCSD